MDIARLNQAITTAISQQDRADTQQVYNAWREIQSVLELARDKLEQYRRTYETSAQMAAPQSQQDYNANQAANPIPPDYLEAWNPRVLEQQLHRGPGRLPKLKD